jgi:hypothetical protein
MSYITKNANSNTSYNQKNFGIDSKKRSGGSSTPISDFRHETSLPRDYDFDRVTVLQAEIPKSYYMLDNDATFQLNEATGSVNTTVTIPGGTNYTSADLATTLATALGSASATGANTFTYAVTLSASTGKFKIVASTGDFTLTFNSTSDDNKVITKYLGFTEGAVTASSASKILFSLNVVDLQRHNVIQIRSDIVNNAGDTILATIYVGSSIDLSMIKYITPDATRHSVGLNDNVASCSNFSLTDGNGKLIKLNGVDFRFVFQAFKSHQNID